MMRHCDGNDPNLIAHNEETDKFEPCECGARFDDVNCSVIYPHQSIGPFTPEGREAIEKLRQAADEYEEHTGERYPGNKRIREEE